MSPRKFLERVVIGKAGVIHEPALPEGLTMRRHHEGGQEILFMGQVVCQQPGGELGIWRWASYGLSTELSKAFDAEYVERGAPGCGAAMRKPALKVVTSLYEVNARQIPEMMRKAAGEIESPPVEGVTVDQALFIARDSHTGQLNIYGWGDIRIEDSMAMLAMLAIANRKLAELADGGDLWAIPQGGSAPRDAG